MGLPGCASSVEYRTTALALNTLTFQRGLGHIAEANQTRRLETHFRSPQLDLWQLSETEWLLASLWSAQGEWSKRSKIVALA